jgi:hypothetical protein
MNKSDESLYSGVNHGMSKTMFVLFFSENMNKSDESLYSGVNHGMSKTMFVLFFSENMNKSDESLYSGVNHGMSKTSSSSLTVQIHNHLSASNPDLSLLMVEDPKQEFPDHVVKVFRADQSFKYLPIHKVCNYKKKVL